MKQELQPWQPLPDNIALIHVPNYEPAKRRVVCAANKFGELIVPGARHFDSIMHALLDRLNIQGKEQHDQGFIDQWGNFMTREEALLVVKVNGQQVSDRAFHSKSELFSEDLY